MLDEASELYFDVKINDIFTFLDDVYSLEPNTFTGVRMKRKYLYCEWYWDTPPHKCYDKHFLFFQLNEQQNIIHNEDELKIISQAIDMKFLPSMYKNATTDQILNTILRLPIKVTNWQPFTACIDYDKLDKMSDRLISV